MRTKAVVWLIVVVVFAIGSISAQQNSSPRLEAIPCPPRMFFSSEPECYVLIVPENRADPASGALRLMVMRYPASRPSEQQPDPLFYLDGGPGAQTSLAADYLRSRLIVFNATRDLIFFDQRGVGLSEPNLDCPEMDAAFLQTLTTANPAEEEREVYLDGVRRCHARLSDAGIAFDGYNSAQSAADVNDLRLAFGYDQVNLFGLSYGTRLALTVMRDYPDSIRSVILDSAYPPQVDGFAERALNAQRSLDLLFAGCAANARCNERYPNLAQVFYQTVDQLNAQPISIEVRSPQGGSTLLWLFTGDDLIGVVFQLLYGTELIPRLPRWIYQASGGQMRGLIDAVAPIIFDTSFADGMNLSVTCGEEASFYSPDALAGVEAQIDPHVLQAFGNFTLDGCAEWALDEADPRENLPVSSDIPTLILAGEYDPVTPPSWGQLAGEALSKHYFFQYPGVGHGVLFADEICPAVMALGFMRDPATAPDSACLQEMRPPGFS